MTQFERSAIPTHKWIATQILAVSALATAWMTAVEWDRTLTISAIGVLTQAVVGYLLPNADTPGGVPIRRVEQKAAAA
jgi:hypothetical protein